MKYLLPCLCLVSLSAWGAPAHFSKGATVSGTFIADHLYGDGSGLSGISGGGGSGDRIVSGSTSMIATSSTGMITVSGTISATGIKLGASTLNSWPVTKCMTSADITLATGTSAFTHGLGSAPTMWWTWIRNTSADAGYSPGDIVSIDGTNGTASGSACGYNLVQNATSTTVVFGNASICIANVKNRSTGAETFVTNAKWVFVVKECI
jgi:hypothetical protein